MKKSTPCWDGYTAKGTKMKNGKKVNNCVPVNKSKKTKKTAVYHVMPNGKKMKGAKHGG